MSTGSLSSAIQDIISSTGYSTKRISIDPGSSLVTAVENTSKAVADLAGQEDGPARDHQDQIVTAKQNSELIQGLRNEGFEVKKPFSKRSQSQSKIESVIKSFKICLKATMLPWTSPLSIVSFVNVARRCAALLNSRPIALLPPTLADPDEILSISPNSLTGPASATWWNLGAARHYSGQQALLQSHLTKFSKNFRVHYANKLYSNSNMATESALQIGDICLITDLSSNSGRSNPLPALGRIEKFLVPESRSQAVLKYHSGKVDRPISKLVRVVKADKEISKKGKTICPYVLADEDIQANWDEEDEEVEDPHEDLRDALQPLVPGTGRGQDVHGHQESVPPPSTGSHPQVSGFV
jgi:hypothetical protein